MADTVFHRIIHGELEADRVYEDERVLVIKDIKPAAPLHLLILPKEKDIPSIKEMQEEDVELLGHMIFVAKKLADKEGLAGYQLLFNVGREGGQEVEYLHLHLMGGWDSETDPDPSQE